MNATPFPSAVALVRAAFATGFVALRKAWLPAAAFIASGALVTIATLAETPLLNWIAVTALFISGIAFSNAHYRALLAPHGALPARTALLLAMTNGLLYLAFSFIGVFAGFFVLILAGILLQESAGASMKEASAEDVQHLMADMLATPYGTLLGLVALALAAALIYIALRLLLSGITTVARGRVQVFSTWGDVRGHLRPVALAAVVTHGLAFLVAFLVWRSLGAVEPTLFLAGLRGAIAAAALLPFFAAGQGLAGAVYAALHGHRAAGEPAASNSD